MRLVSIHFKYVLISIAIQSNTCVIYRKHSPTFFYCKVTNSNNPRSLLYVSLYDSNEYSKFDALFH